MLIYMYNVSMTRAHKKEHVHFVTEWAKNPGKNYQEKNQATATNGSHQGHIESPRTRGHAARDHQKLYEYNHFP